MGNKEVLSGADNAWRRMGVSTNLTTITGVMTFSSELEYDELIEVIEERLLRFDRFSHRLGGRNRTIRRPYWETDEQFDIESQVHDIELPEPRNSEQLMDFVGSVMSKPLDERRPLWEVYYLREYQEGSAIVVRLNHSLADGFALLYVLFGLADDPEGIRFPIGGLSTPPLTESQRAKSKSRAESTGAMDDETAVTEETPPVSESSGSGGPLTGLKKAGGAIKTGIDLLTMDDEPETSLRGELGTAKRAAWTDELDVEPIKSVGKAHDATINDVLLAATAGVFRRILEDRGEETEGLTLRCTVPVNLKPMAERDEQLGNHFGLAFVPIPVGEQDLGDRIDYVHQRTSRHTLGAQAYIIYSLLELGGRVPERIFRKILKQFEGNATAVVSNVPGPMDRIELAGKEVNKIMFWNPQANDQGLSVSIFTYDGTVRVGISGDANLIPDPQQLTDAFEAEIDELVSKYA